MLNYKLDGELVRLQRSSAAVFHAAHEFLLNAVKHSGTASANVTLQMDHGDFLLAISDLGVGFEKLQSGAQNSFGLFQIRQRLEARGGQLVIDSAAGQGTRVSVRLPIAANPD